MPNDTERTEEPVSRADLARDTERRQEERTAMRESAKFLVEALNTKMPATISNAICKIMGEIAAVPKRGENAFHGYKYATSSDILAVLKDKLAEEHLLITMHTTGLTKDSGGNMMVGFIFRFNLGEEHWVYPGVWYGVAGDMTKRGLGDKYFSKAVTAAEKYFLLKLFKIPTGDEEEADADGEERAERRVSRESRTDSRPPAEPTAEPRRRRTGAKDDENVPPEIVEARKTFERLSTAFEEAKTIDMLRSLWRSNAPELDKVRAASQEGYDRLAAKFDSRLAALRKEEAAAPSDERQPGDDREETEPPPTERRTEPSKANGHDRSAGIDRGSSPQEVDAEIDRFVTEINAAQTEREVGQIWIKHAKTIDVLKELAPAEAKKLEQLADDRADALRPKDAPLV